MITEQLVFLCQFHMLLRILQTDILDLAVYLEVFQNEVFGPVLTVTAFKTDEEAVNLSNSTDFGLASGIWTSNLSRAHRMIRKIKAGTVFVNTYGGSDNSLPLTGVKQSGNGSDKSLHALDKFTDLKTVWMKL